jgi:hypothetical protein
VSEERPPGLGIQALGRQAVVATGALEEVLGEQQGIVAALAERRQCERDHGQPVVEVLAKTPGTGGGGEIRARCRDHPGVDRLAPRAAQPAKRLFLDHLEELTLQALRQERHLVQEDGAAVGELEQARLGLAGVGEGPALLAEELRLEQCFGNRRAVEVDEGPVPSGAGPVHRAGEEALAGAGLALDQDGRQSPPV